MVYWDPRSSNPGLIAFRETDSPELLERCDNDIEQYLNIPFNCSHLVIATWLQVDSFYYFNTQVVFDSFTVSIICVYMHKCSHNSSLLFCDIVCMCALQSYQFNVFQAVLASSDTTSAILLNYGTLQFGRGLVGVSAGDGIRFLQFPESRTPAAQSLPLLSNVNVPGVFAFRTDGILVQRPVGMFTDTIS